MLKKILVVLSENPRTSSHVRAAIDVAKRNGAEITGFVAVDEDDLRQVGPAPVGAFSYRYALAEGRVAQGFSTADASIADLREVCAEAEVPFKALETSGRQDRRLSDAWRFQDLAILPTQVWNPGFRGLGNAETLLHFVAMGMRPLLVVPQGFDRLPKKTVVALSGSLDSAKAFKHFVQMRPFGDTAVHLVTVGQPKSAETADELLDHAADYARAHGLAVTSAALAHSDDRVQTLLDHAAEVDGEAFVVGSSYRHFVLFTRFGSHALGLLERTGCPVFVSH
jgi:nucleotide-binding universal stress UspA family protein